MGNWTDPTYTKSVTVSDGKISATFFVEIIAAEDYSRHDMSRGNVTEAVPGLRVTTHKTYDDAGEIIIRKRSYSVDEVFQPTTYDGVPAWRTSLRDHYTRGVRNENGATLEYDSATRKQLDKLAGMARDAFITNNQNWQVQSLRRGLLAKIRREESEAANYARQVAEHESKAEGFRKQLEGM